MTSPAATPASPGPSSPARLSVRTTELADDDPLLTLLPADENVAWLRRDEGLVGYGVADYPLELCWDDYVFAMLQVPLVATFGCAYSTSRTERGDRMFAVMVARGCAAIRDLGTLGLVAGI